MTETIYERPIPAGALDLTGEVFKPIMSLPENLPVFDFTQSYDPERMLDFPAGVGRYDEVRPSMYTEGVLCSRGAKYSYGD